jgi:hypothetical protein
MKLSERFFAVGLLTTALGVACTGGVMPVQVGGPGPTDSEPDEGKAPAAGKAGTEQTSAQTSGSGPTTTTTAQGPTSTGSNTTSSVSSTGSGGCTENAACSKCASCLQSASLCGSESAASTKVCKCNAAAAPAGKSSLDLYVALGQCVCPACGSVCAKTCTGSGTDQSTCVQCLNSQVTSQCMSQLAACQAK